MSHLQIDGGHPSLLVTSVTHRLPSPSRVPGQLIPHFSKHNHPLPRRPVPMRQLSLHVSALNDLEYATYTEALHDLIADDQPVSDDYQNVSVGAREVRAWLRGRYPSMPLSDVDAVRSLVAFRKIPPFHVNSDSQIVLSQPECPRLLQRRTVLRSHAPGCSCKRQEGRLQVPCVYSRCGNIDYCCAARINSHLI